MATPDRAGSSLIHRPENYFQRLDLGTLFPKAQPLEVELGAGDGSFLVQWARLHPERNFLGVERLLGRLRKIDRKGRRAGLENLRAIRIEAGYLVEWLLPPGCAAALHIYFPDPWPKRRHKPRRLINRPFAAAAARALEPGGVVHLRTDDADYFEQMLAVFGGGPEFTRTEPPAELLAVLTDFEQDFRQQGRSTFHAAFARTRPPG